MQDQNFCLLMMWRLQSKWQRKSEQSFICYQQVLKEAEIEDNPVERCYLCKKIIFSKIREEAQKMGVSVLIEETNADDLLVYRPGIRAIKELGIVSSFS